MTHSKKIFALGYLIFCGVMMFGLVGSVKAENRKFGEECSNYTCASGECEESNSEDDAYKGKKYCTCDEARDCISEFTPVEGEIWSCDDKDKFNLHYCKSTVQGHDKHAGPGAKQYSTWDGVTQGLTNDEIRQMISKPVLKIKIPGLKFTDPTGNKEDGGTYLFVNYLGEYIRSLYRYGIAVAAILAVIMIIKAGFMWTASGGSSEVISKQKETIEKAIVGLIIAVSSYTILFAINPKLVEFNSLKVEYVKGIEAIAGPSPEEPSPFGPSTAEGGNNGVPYFAQFMGPWATRSPDDGGTPPWQYNNLSGETCTTIHQRGCGSTSFAMIMAYYGFQTDPFETGKWGLACKGVFPINATVGNRAKMQEKWPGIKGEVVVKGQGRDKIRSKILSSLKNKNPILFNCHPCEGNNRDGGPAHVYSNGHFVVITGFHDENIDGLSDDKIFVNINDPGSNRALKRSIETMSLTKVLDTFLVAGFFTSDHPPEAQNSGQNASSNPVPPNEPNSSEEEPNSSQ